MDRFEYSDSRLSTGETYLVREKGIRLYDGDTKTTFESGEVVVTSHRLLWGQPGDIPRGLTCLSLALRYIVFVEEEQLSGLFSKSRRIIFHLSEALQGKNMGPVSYSPNHFIKLSFKEGVNDEFIPTLNNAVQARKWEFSGTSLAPGTSGASKPAGPGIKLRTGIVGIERGILEKQKVTDESISVAFQDLSKLMAMAKEMVHLSNNISTKIRERQGDITEDETVRFKSYLLSLGIDDPVTRDSYTSENQYHESLARQIADILTDPIKEIGGMMSLADAYCRVNRARGLELLSPEDLLCGCYKLEKFSLPIRLRTFDSGAMVLQHESHSDAAIVESTASALSDSGSLSAEELAQALGISVLLAKERLSTTEKHGRACRDESIEGLRFYINRFLLEEAS